MKHALSTRTLRLLAILLFSAAGFTANAQYAEPQLPQDSTVMKERNNGIYFSGYHALFSWNTRLHYDRVLLTKQGRKYTRTYYWRTSAGRTGGWDYDDRYVTAGITCAFKGSRRLHREIGINLMVRSYQFWNHNTNVTTYSTDRLLLPTIGYRYHTKYGLSYRFGLIDGGGPIYYSIGYAF